jgi:hypothetical protein
MPRSQIERHDQRDNPIDPLAALLLRRLPIIDRVLLDGNVPGHPPQYGMAGMPQLLSQNEFFEPLGRRAHSGVPPSL